MQTEDVQKIELLLDEIIRDRDLEEPGMRKMATTARVNLRNGKLWRVRRFIKTHRDHWKSINKKKRAVMSVEIIGRMKTDQGILRALPKHKFGLQKKDRIAKAR